MPVRPASLITQCMLVVCCYAAGVLGIVPLAAGFVRRVMPRVPIVMDGRVKYNEKTGKRESREAKRKGNGKVGKRIKERKKRLI